MIMIRTCCYCCWWSLLFAWFRWSGGSDAFVSSWTTAASTTRVVVSSSSSSSSTHTSSSLSRVRTLTMVRMNPNIHHPYSDDDYSDTMDDIPSFCSRRIFASSLLLIVSSTFLPSASDALLDMDAFAAQQLTQTTPTPTTTATTTTTAITTSSDTPGDANAMSADEAQCRFGSPSQAKGDACRRANMSIAPRTKNGVDAYGNVASRTTYAKCTKQYTLVNNEYYTSEWVCE